MKYYRFNQGNGRCGSRGDSPINALNNYYRNGWGAVVEITELEHGVFSVLHVNSAVVERVELMGDV
jgi:hypothetical protein|tara:strand:+ start:2783 stop:2980 length:198 start_codon:yes stop_codon:yes gene_type:complete